MRQVALFIRELLVQGNRFLSEEKKSRLPPNGTFLAAIATDNPDARGVAADLPHAAIAAEETFAANGLSERCMAVSCDFMRSIPADGDLYILSNVLHDWDDDQCQKILINCRKAMRKDSKLLIVEFMVPPANVFSPAKLLDIEMMVMSGGGRERTEDEFCDLLAAAGLNMDKITPLVTGETLLEAVIIS